MTQNNQCCSDGNCGCKITIFPTDTRCPDCGRLLHLIGRSELVEFRLTCRHCDYQSSLLSKEELQEVL